MDPQFLQFQPVEAEKRRRAVVLGRVGEEKLELMEPRVVAVRPARDLMRRHE